MSYTYFGWKVCYKSLLLGHADSYQEALNLALDVAKCCRDKGDYVYSYVTFMFEEKVSNVCPRNFDKLFLVEYGELGGGTLERRRYTFNRKTLMERIK